MGTELTGTQKQVFEKERTRREKLSGFCFDLAKLMFAGTIIANISVFISDNPMSVANVIVIIFGIIWTYVLATIANRLLIY